MSLLAPLPLAELRLRMRQLVAHSTPTPKSVAESLAVQDRLGCGGHDDCAKNIVTSRFPKAFCFKVWLAAKQDAVAPASGGLDRRERQRVSFEFAGGGLSNKEVVREKIVAFCDEYEAWQRNALSTVAPAADLLKYPLSKELLQQAVTDSGCGTPSAPTSVSRVVLQTGSSKAEDFTVDFTSYLQVLASMCVVTVATASAGAPAAAASSAAGAAAAAEPSPSQPPTGATGVDLRLLKVLLRERFPAHGGGSSGHGAGFSKANLLKVVFVLCTVDVEREHPELAPMFSRTTRCEMDAGETRATAWGKFVKLVSESKLTDGDWATIEALQTEYGDPLLTCSDLTRDKLDAAITTSPADVRAKVTEVLSAAWVTIDSIRNPPPSGHNCIDAVGGVWQLMTKLFPEGPAMVALFAVAAGKRGDCANLRALAPLIEAERKASGGGGGGRARRPGSHSKRSRDEGDAGVTWDGDPSALIEKLKVEGLLQPAAPALREGELLPQQESSLWTIAHTTSTLADGQAPSAGTQRARLFALATKRAASAMGQLEVHAAVVEAKQVEAEGEEGEEGEEEGAEEDEEEGEEDDDDEQPAATSG